MSVEECASDLAELPVCGGVCKWFGRIVCCGGACQWFGRIACATSDLVELPICGGACQWFGRIAGASDLAELFVCWQFASDLAAFFLPECGGGVTDLAEELFVCWQCANDLAEMFVCRGQCASDLAELLVCGGACQWFGRIACASDLVEFPPVYLVVCQWFGRIICLLTVC